MPNHITNRITTANPDVFLELEGPDSIVDFKRLVPRPASLDLDHNMAFVDMAHTQADPEFVEKARLEMVRAQQAGSAVDHFRAGDYGKASAHLRYGNLCKTLEGPKVSMEDLKTIAAMVSNIRLYGHATWYDWSNEKWGTKWNAYDVVRVSPDAVQFDTAWSMPGPVAYALAQKFPVVPITWEWADEDFGHNAGRIEMRDGDFTGGPHEDGSREAEELALELVYNGEIPDHMERNADGRLVYVEDEE